MPAVQDYLVNVFVGNVANYYQFSLYETKRTTCTALSITPAKSYRSSSSFVKNKKQKKNPTPQIFFSSKRRYPAMKSV